ncbi:MAG: hypothetical protein ABSC16_04685 [Candidatus Dormibacteria bacterium]|jgi:hypothetical protein|nr:hypothetical protein [Chloroflexota bacterium]
MNPVPTVDFSLSSHQRAAQLLARDVLCRDLGERLPTSLHCQEQLESGRPPAHRRGGPGRSCQGAWVGICGEPGLSFVAPPQRAERLSHTVPFGPGRGRRASAQ